ncbi:MAG: methylenetetrahydrofolate reductase [NAD(P)H] [Candidatus Gastranaerophilales bacterium]|nr:methylenetetrahydrofolate reductase [NAD(P)H] [Candidatus Gastranaerophilales bacterium]
MKLSQIYSQNPDTPVISYEIFPPKGEDDEYEKKLAELFFELKILKKFSPSFISVTYGAGGSTQEKTFDLVLKIKNELNITPMPHFTCVNANRQSVCDYIKKVENNGINNILALRGDPPLGSKAFVSKKNGFDYANELVKFIRSQTNLSIAAAGYPEKHPQAETFAQDISNLKRKVDEGVDVVITQLFFDNDDFFQFCQKAQEAGINVPIIPGIMPVTKVSQMEKITSMCGAKVPQDLYKKLLAHQEDFDYVRKLGIEFCISQVNNLINYGVKGLHFYTLNKAFAVKEILENVSCNTNQLS